MSFNLSFTCDYTEIDIKEWLAKGYEIKLIDRPNYGKNRQAVIVIKTNYIDDDDTPIIDAFEYSMSNVALVTGSNTMDDKLIIPQQGYVNLESSEHPRKDECVFLNLKNIDFTDIVIEEDFDDNSSYYRCSAEETFVLDLLMGHIGVYEPFTQKWIDFYNEYNYLARQIIENNRLLLENQIKMLMKLKLNCWN